MGTRGAYGFIIDGEEKITYNHCDSYLEGLGKQVMEFIASTPIEEMKEIAKRIKMVEEDSKPTKEQQEHCINLGLYSSEVSLKSPEDWYCLLRNAQGELDIYKEGLEYMIDNHDFLFDSLYCEYAYIINLDTGKLEIYQGFNKNIKAEGRYANCKVNSYGYCGVKLIKEIDYQDIAIDLIDELINNLNVILEK